MRLPINAGLPLTAFVVALGAFVWAGSKSTAYSAPDEVTCICTIPKGTQSG